MKYLLIVCVLFVIVIGARAKKRPTPKAAEPAHVTQVDIARVSQATKNKALLYFWKPNCPGCLEMSPIVDKVAAEYPDIAVIKINTADENNRPVHDEYRIHATPSFVILQNGKETTRYERPFWDKQAYISFLQPSKIY